MEDSKVIFESYIQIANALGQTFQKILEIVVHDFRDLVKAITHIVNGHLELAKRQHSTNKDLGS